MNKGKFSMFLTNEKNKNWERLIKTNDGEKSTFSRDYSLILKSSAYKRLKNKTQVFFNVDENDDICTRIKHSRHVELVSSIIARTLGLNEQLTRAIALAHDLGHAPFGHEGEKVINKLSHDNLNKSFGMSKMDYIF